MSYELAVSSKIFGAPWNFANAGFGVTGQEESRFG